jgi:hypothetical protein
MTNPGDPDLYVRFDQNPETNAYDCRPYLSGAEETCSLDVPANVTAAHVRESEAIHLRTIPSQSLIPHPHINSLCLGFFREEGLSLPLYVAYPMPALPI